MGFVDRGGSRESKGNSLRRSKKNPGAAAARAAGAKQAYKPPAQPEVAPALHKGTKKNPYFDCSAALLSRQFDADIDDVLDRAEQQCAGVVIWSADIDKQHQVVSMSQENSGFVYAAVGLHPDNVRGTHQREFEKWFQQVEDLSKARGCVAILSGLNLLRETATHFPQETVLRNMMATAKKNGRPLFLHCAQKHAETAERLLTLLEDYHTENGNSFPTAVVMHTFLTASNFNSQTVKKFAKLGCYFTVSAAELHSLCGGANVATAADAADEASAASANTPVVAGTTNTATLSRTPKQAEEDLAAFVDCLLSVLTPSHVLLASDSPWHTPQTISDDYIRSQKNEPSNFPDIIESLELAIVTFAANANKTAPGSVDEKVLLEKLKTIVNGAKDTSVKVFEIPEKDVEVAAASPAEVDAEGSTDAKKGKGKKDKHADEEDQEEESHGKKGSGNGKGGNKKGSRKKGKHGDDSDEEEEDDAHQNSSIKGKGAGKGGNGKGGKKKGARFDDGSDDDETDAHQKKGGKKGKSKHDDSDDEDQFSSNKKNKGGKKNNNKKGKHDSDEDSDDHDEKTTKSNSAPKSKKNSKRANDSDESESDDSNDEKIKTETKRRAAASSDKKVVKSAIPFLSYACLKCRTKLFIPSDLIVPDDASLCSQGFFIKAVPADEQKEDEDEDEEDENNKLLPSTLRITPNTNGEIECRKCSAPKLGRCGFKLGVPGFAIRITPSKVEIVDANVSLEDLQRKALAEAERYQQEAEEAENASDSDDDGKKKKEHKKNVKANNRSNFTHFRNKNFAPKSVKVSTEVDGDDGDEHSDSSDSEPKKNEKGKRRK